MLSPIVSCVGTSILRWRALQSSVLARVTSTMFVGCQSGLSEQQPIERALMCARGCRPLECHCYVKCRPLECHPLSAEGGLRADGATLAARSDREAGG